MDRWGIAALTLVATAVTACSPSATDDVASDEATTSATRTPRITDDSGRPPVTFDPCYDIPDDVMNAAGYDAGKKEIADMPMGSYTFLGCMYRKDEYIPGVRRGYGINILAGNVTLDEEVRKNGHISKPMTINDRSALLRVHPSESLACTYVLETSFGIVIFDRLYYADTIDGPPVDEWCQGLDQLVTSIEPFLN